MATCALCGAEVLATGGRLHFDRQTEFVNCALSLELCTACGLNVEKHLKRRIPGNLFRYVYENDARLPISGRHLRRTIRVRAERA